MKMPVLIVGELINTSRKAIKEAVAARDAASIQQIALEQEKAGANYIDVNCGTLVYEEVETMEWLVKTVQEVITKTPLCFDSPNHQAIEAALKLHKNGQPMINSITAEKERFATILPLVLEYRTKVVALLMDDAGMPDNSAKRMQIADKLLPELLKAGVPAGDIYLDPLITPISAVDQAGKAVLETVQYINRTYPEVHTICGLSNISYGLPNRKYLNQTFAILAMGAGMDSFILNPTDRQLMGFAYAAQALTGQDRYCMRYLKAHRSGLYEVG